MVLFLLLLSMAMVEIWFEFELIWNNFYWFTFKGTPDCRTVKSVFAARRTAGTDPVRAKRDAPEIKTKSAVELSATLSTGQMSCVSVI